MDSTYRAIEREVKRRRRRLNALRGLRLGLLLSTGLTAIYGLGTLLGVFSVLSPWILVGVVGLGAWAGLRWGQTRPIDLQKELYRVDRALGLDEKLTTIYELRRRPGGSSAEILRVLYRQIEGLRLDPEKALPLPPSERHGWLAVGGLAGLSLVFLLLWFLGVSPLKIAWDQLLPRFPGEEPSAALVSPSDERSKEDSSLKDQSATGADETNLSARKTRCRSGSDRSARLTEDGTVDCEDENAVAGQAGASPSAAPSAASLAELKALKGALQQLLDQLRRGRISPEQARQSLQDLADQAPSDSLKEALQRVAKALQAEGMQRELKEALQQLQDQIQEQAERQSSREDGTVGKDGGGSQQNPPSSASQPQGSQGTAGANAEAEAGQPPSQSDAANAPSGKADSAAEGQSQEERDKQTQGEGTEGESKQAQGQQGEQGAKGESESADQAGERQAQAQGQGEKSAQGSGQEGEAQTSGESRGKDASESPQSADGESARAKSDAEKRPANSSEEGAPSQQTGGDEPGLESGANVRDAGSNEGLAASQDLLIRGAPLPQDAQLLDRLLTQGLPVDVAGREPDGRPILRVSLERVEALLELRDLPPELRALVRAYFLALAEEGGGR